MPYLLISDTHHHGWSAFSHTLPNGVNSRNQIILDETYRQAKEAKDRWGIDTIIHAGDLFHVRGSIATSVLNPVLETYRRIVDDLGMRVYILAGNHDMEGKDSGVMTNAVEAMRGIDTTPISQTTIVRASNGLGDRVVLVPWFSSVVILREEIERIRASLLTPEWKLGGPKEHDLVLHAPLNGVIKGIPDHGLDPEWLAGLGFRRVFCGHYHNHKSFDGGVFSIGALTHQTWGDVGSKAGALIVGDEFVEWRASRAPSFVDISADDDPDELALRVDGNYVRAKIEVESESEVPRLRQDLLNMGAAGATILPISKRSAVSRTGATVKTGASVAHSIHDFVRSKKYAQEEKVLKMCDEVLATAKEANA
jgi:DNA repair exonuclease SbcCD nuclease subunit